MSDTENPTGGSDAKRLIRKQVLAGRDALTPDAQRVASSSLAAHAAFLHGAHPTAIVAGYWPWRSEIDVRPLMLALHALGHRLSLPIIEHPAMLFREWRPEDSLVDAGFGTLGPGPAAPEVVPDVILVPLAAFDRAGNRIGWGKGHYDRALARLPQSIACGVAHALQQIAAVPAEAHDRPLHAVLTDQEWIDCRPT
jgi:5-formyltetrahydrofolate cyclo-ligase